MEDTPFLCLTSAEVGETINDSLVVARVLEYCLQWRVTDLHGLSRAFQLLVRQVSFGWKMNVMVCLACRKMVLQVEECNLLYVAGRLKYATSSGQRCQAPRLTPTCNNNGKLAFLNPQKGKFPSTNAGLVKTYVFPKEGGSNLQQFGISGLHSSPTYQSPAPQRKSLPILWDKHRSQGDNCCYGVPPCYFLIGAKYCHHEYPSHLSATSGLQLVDHSRSRVACYQRWSF